MTIGERYLKVLRMTRNWRERHGSTLVLWEPRSRQRVPHVCSGSGVSLTKSPGCFCSYLLGLFCLFCFFFFLIEELLDAVLESDDDEDEDDEVSWWLLMPHGELVPSDSESRPYLEKSLRKRGF